MTQHDAIYLVGSLIMMNDWQSENFQKPPKYDDVICEQPLTQPSDDDMWIVARIPSKSKIISDYGNFLEDEKDKDDGKVWDELNSVFKEIKAAPMSPETR